VAREELGCALCFVTSAIGSLPEGEKTAAVGYCDGFNERELIYASKHLFYTAGSTL
jgi:hypothetical protein